MSAISKFFKFKPATVGRFAQWRIICLVVTGALIAGALFVAYFISQNFGKALANEQEINFLKSNPSFDALDLPAYNKAKQAIAAKKDIKPFAKNARYIFNYGTGTDKLSSISATSAHATTTSASSTK